MALFKDLIFWIVFTEFLEIFLLFLANLKEFLEFMFLTRFSNFLVEVVVILVAVAVAVAVAVVVLSEIIELSFDLPKNGCWGRHVYFIFAAVRSACVSAKRT